MNGITRKMLLERTRKLQEMIGVKLILITDGYRFDILKYDANNDCFLHGRTKRELYDKILAIEAYEGIRKQYPSRIEQLEQLVFERIQRVEGFSFLADMYLTKEEYQELRKLYEKQDIFTLTPDEEIPNGK